MKNNHLLFIGPYSKNPKGGVAFVLSEYEKLFPDAYFVASTKSKNKLTKILGFIWGITHFVYLLRTRPKINIVHIHGASYSSFKRKYIIYKIAKFFNKKVIYHIHGGAFHKFYNEAKPALKQKIQRIINNSDAIVCLSNHWRDFFSTHFTPQYVTIIPNIIPRPNKEFVLKIKSQKIEFLFLGLSIALTRNTSMLNQNDNYNSN